MRVPILAAALALGGAAALPGAAVAQRPVLMHVICVENHAGYVAQVSVDGRTHSGTQLPHDVHSVQAGGRFCVSVAPDFDIWIKVAAWEDGAAKGHCAQYLPVRQVSWTVTLRGSAASPTCIAQ